MTKVSVADNSTPPIAIERWGKDHWSTLAYLETRCVDYRGELDPQHMRCDLDRNPLQGNRGTHMSRNQRHPTILKGGDEVKGHDDWECVWDMIMAGLVQNNGTDTCPMYSLTDEGWEMTQAMRRFHAGGGNYANFEVVK